MSAARVIAGVVLVAGLSATRADPPRVDLLGDPLPPGAVARLGSSRWQHGGSVSAVVFSPDGKALLSGDQDGRILCWDAATGQERWRTEHRPDLETVNDLAFAPDGTRFAAAWAKRPPAI